MPRGCQVFGCYGAKAAASLLLHYGFCPWTPVPGEAVPLRVGATFQGPADAATRERKAALFSALAGGGGRLALEVQLTADAPLPPLLLAAARVCCMTSSEASTCDASAVAAHTPVSSSNEAAARAFLAQLIGRRIMQLVQGTDTSWEARVQEARSEDCVGEGDAACAVTPQGASIAYKAAAVRVLRLALDACGAGEGS